MSLPHRLDRVSTVEGPPSDPVRLLDHWREAAAGDVTPGRVVANLKQAGMPEFLASTLSGLHEVGADVAAVAALVDVWSQWERGQLGPQSLLDALGGGGLEDLLARRAAAQAEVFGDGADAGGGDAADGGDAGDDGDGANSQASASGS